MKDKQPKYGSSMIEKLKNRTKTKKFSKIYKNQNFPETKE